MLKFGFATRKGISLRGTASFDIFCVDVRGGVLAVGLINPHPTPKKKPRNNFNFVREVAHARKQNPYPIWITSCRVIGIPDVIINANLGNDLLRGFGVTGGQILPFP